jgi:hypothetical protein
VVGRAECSLQPEFGLVETFSIVKGLSVPDLWTEREMTFLPTLID